MTAQNNVKVRYSHGPNPNPYPIPWLLRTLAIAGRHQTYHRIVNPFERFPFVDNYADFLRLSLIHI